MQSEPDTFRERVLSTVGRYAMLTPGERTLVAVSGGPDSVALLHVLEDLGYALEVAHFDHQTRNGQSAEDAQFVADLAAGLSLPFHLGTGPIEAEARDSGLSFEAYARKARYAFLTRTAIEAGCAAIATGHHADDQAETMLMRLMRGTGPRGLGGIRPVREVDGVRIVRPLLRCTREEILGYVEARGLAYCTDRTNTDTRYVRNRIRHALLPALMKDYNPGVREALLRLSEVLQCESDFLDVQAAVALEGWLVAAGRLDRERFRGAHEALQRRGLQALAWRHGIDCPFQRIDAAVRFVAAAPAGKRFDLGSGCSLLNTRGATEVVEPAAHTEPPETIEVRLDVPGVTAASGKRFAVSFQDVMPLDTLPHYCSPGRQVFDADALGRELTLRHKRPGDRFSPYGMTGTKKLKDYFIDIGLPACQRDAQLLVVAHGRIAWIVGHAIAADVAVTPQTRRLLEIEVTHAA